jgi:outer membrane protein TolC
MKKKPVVLAVLALSAAYGADRPQILTLQDAQARALAASKLSELANLGVKGARQRREGVQADYLPKVGAHLVNLHFNKSMGKLIALVDQPFGGLRFLDKDLTVVSAKAIQPVTPIFQIRQAVRLARADERIAQAKADAAAAAVKSSVQSAYFALLIAQRQQVAAEARSRNADSPVRLASTAAATAKSDKALAATNDRVEEFTEALRELIGGARGVTYELLPPPLIDEAVDNGPVPALGIERNPDVVEAREGVVKASAALKVAKLNYMPEVVGVGGYVFQNAIPIIRRDFSYIGIMATWNVYDFGKRERLLAEGQTQLRMAELNLELVRAKVVAKSAKASADVESARRMLRLARRVVKMLPSDAVAERAEAEAEMFQADLDFRLAMERVNAVGFNADGFATSESAGR